ncbi:hypothetical protein GCM10027348_33680 [Hymenobacter tenuis]
MLLAAACSAESGSGKQPTAPLPVGHYEGPISYQGTELRVALDLRTSTEGNLQAEVSFPQLPGLEFDAIRPRYREPQLLLEQEPGRASGVMVQAVREGDFLRGVLSWNGVQSDFVWVRRGEAPARGFREQKFPLRYAGYDQTSRLLVPDDTLLQHPAVALMAFRSTQATAQARATYLARRGFVTLLVITPEPRSATDSTIFQATVGALQALRRQSSVDSTKVGCWGRGSAAPQVAKAAAQAQPLAAFVVLEAAPAATREQASAYQPLNKQRIPVLALYAGLDTTVQVKESARRMRTALGRRNNKQVREYAQATADFTQPGRTGPDGQWQWPKPVPGYWDGVIEWLQAVTR